MWSHRLSQQTLEMKIETKISQVLVLCFSYRIVFPMQWKTPLGVTQNGSASFFECITADALQWVLVKILWKEWFLLEPLCVWRGAQLHIGLRFWEHKLHGYYACQGTGSYLSYMLSHNRKPNQRSEEKKLLVFGEQSTFKEQVVCISRSLSSVAM